MAKKGFSLIELIIVFSLIISLLSVMAIPYKHFFITGNRSSSFLKILNCVERTRLTARCYARAIRIDFFENKYEAWCEDQMLFEDTFPFRVKENVSLRFNEKGIPSKAVSVIFVGETGRFIRTLVISAQGRIRYE